MDHRDTLITTITDTITTLGLIVLCGVLYPRSLFLSCVIINRAHEKQPRAGWAALCVYSEIITVNKFPEVKWVDL